MARLKLIEGKTTTRLISGNMYYFKYLAEPRNLYFDKFPLVFILRKRRGLYEGINFHYLNPKRRIELFENMKPYFSTTDILTEKTILFVKKFREIIQRSKIFRSAKVSFRKYKKENIQSQIIEVNPNDWLLSLQQPAELFIKEGIKVNSMLVWKDSLRLQRT